MEGVLGYGFRTPFQSAREHGGVENVKQELGGGGGGAVTDTTVRAAVT